MNEDVLYEAGLTKSEAKVYILLVKNSPCSPPKLADMATESRTNTYKLLDALEAKGLVSRDETQKKNFATGRIIHQCFSTASKNSASTSKQPKNAYRTLCPIW